MKITNRDLKEQYSSLKTNYELTKVSVWQADQLQADFRKKHEKELKPEVLASKLDSLRQELCNEQREAFESGTALVKSVIDNADQYSRASFLGQSPVLPATKVPDGIDASAAAIIGAIRQSHEETACGTLPANWHRYPTANLRNIGFQNWSGKKILASQA